VQLVLLGAPGSGKGTQAKRMVAEYGLIHISTGDMLRQEIAAGSDLGAVIESYLKAGYLVPDHHATSLADQRLGKTDIANGFILDGFPRTVRQAESLDEILRIREISLSTVALIDVPDEIVVKRISGRRIDPQTGRIYNLGDIAADQAPADVLSRLEIRDDDGEEVIRHRLATFHDQTDPVVAYYESRGDLLRIDGTQAPETVFETLIAGSSLPRDHGDSVPLNAPTGEDKIELYRTGVTKFTRQEYPAALEDLFRAVEIDPEFGDAHQAIAHVHEKLENFDEALQAAKKAVACNPEDALAHTSLSMCFQRKGMIPEAEAAMAQAAQLQQD